MLALILGVVFVASLFGTIAGFGIGTILLPTLLLFYPFEQALCLVGIVHFVANVGRISAFKKGIDWKIALMFGIPAIALTFVGASLVGWIESSILKAALGVFLVVYSIRGLMHSSWKVKPSTLNGIIGGSLAGFVAGAIGTGGTIRGAFLTAFRLKKATYLATTALLSMVVDLTRVPVYLYNGFLIESLYTLVPVLVVLTLFGVYVGKKLANKISEKQYTTIVYVILIIMGLKILYGSL